MQQHEWDVVDAVPPKLGHWDYGYVKHGQTFGSTHHGLIDLVRSGAPLSLVWTPETPHPVPPETVPFLLEAFRKKEIAAARKFTTVGLLGLSFAAALAISLRDWIPLNPNLVVLIAALILMHGIWLKVRSLDYTKADGANDASVARFHACINRQPIGSYTFLVAACVVAGSLPQMADKDWIARFGLVKAAVWNGEVWRLFTAMLIYGDFSSVYCLFLAAIPLSKTIERLVQRAVVPLVFLLTALIGNVFSVLLRPSTTSTGASGGFMGLLGFVAITLWLDQNRYPRKQFIWVMQFVVIFALLGTFGFEFLDNAIHLGGFLSGVLMGWLFFRQNKQGSVKWEKLFRISGTVALTLLCFIAAFMAYHFFR